MKTFRIRCSSIGKIMGQRGLGQTGKTYLDQWITEQVYGRTKDFYTKFTEKGNIQEETGLDFIAKQLGYGLLVKNEKTFRNKHLIGTPDVILGDHIIDEKNSWDCFTFPLTDTEVPNTDYYYQGQGYMELTGLNKFKLIYVLSDTPDPLIYREASNFCFKNGMDLTDDILEAYREQMKYSNIDAALRIKVFEFERDDETIKKIYERVEESRQYIAERVKDFKLVTAED